LPATFAVRDAAPPASVQKYPGVRGSAPGQDEDASLTRTGTPFPQSAPYEHAARACGADACRLDLGCGTALVIRRGPMQLVSRGPVWLPDVTASDKRAALRRLARWSGVTLATLPEPLQGFGLIPLITPFHHAIWDLSADLRVGMGGKWRNRLVAAERAGVRVRQVRGAGLLPGWRALVAAGGALRATRRYRAHPETFSLSLPVPSLRLWDWRIGGSTGAAMGFVVHGGTATYHLGWAGPDARARGVHGVMLTCAAEAIWAEGIRTLDLGSVNDQDAPGLAHFKLGTGARPVSLGPTCLVLPG